MASAPQSYVPSLTLEQSVFIQRPRNVAEERAIIGRAKLDFALLSMLSDGRISEVLGGERVGKFWVTKDHRIVAEPHVENFGKSKEINSQLDNMKSAAIVQLDIIIKEAKTRQNLPPQHEVSTDGNCKPVSVSYPIEIGFADLRQRCARIDSVRTSLGSTEINYPFSLVLDNTYGKECSTCYRGAQFVADCCSCNDTSCKNYRNYLLLTGRGGICRTLVDVYADTNGISVECAVSDLKETLRIHDDSPFAEPSAYPRIRICRSETTKMLPPIDHNVPQVSVYSQAAKLIGVVQFHLLLGGTKAIIPFTASHFATGDWESWFCLPFTKPYPLINWPVISGFPKATVLLTDCIEFASFAYSNALYFCPTEIWTSWYGGRECVADVNWKILRNRKVVYALFTHSGLSVEQVYETALQVYFRLLDVEGVDLKFARDNPISPCVSGPEITPEEFLESAGMMNLAGVIAKFRERRLIDTYRPEGLNEMDVTEEPCDFLLHPFLCRGDISVLYGDRGLGKTAMALRIALAVAFGYPLFDPLCAKAPGKVFYLDGEVGRNKMKLRIASAMRALGATQGVDDGNSFYYRFERLSVYSEEGRCKIDKMLSNVAKAEPTGLPIAMLVIDNLTSLVNGTDTSSGWDRFYSWACEYRDRGISVLILHHENDEGFIKGTKDKLINADNVIHLNARRSENADDDVGFLHVSCVFEKLRNKSFPEASFTMDVDYDLHREKWSMVDVDEYRSKVMQHQTDAGYTDAKMAAYWGVKERQLKALRMKYGIRKYNVDDGSPSVTGELTLLP